MGPTDLEKLENLDLEVVSSEKDFLAPLLIKGRQASIVIPTLDCWGTQMSEAKAQLAKALETNELWYRFQQNKDSKTTTVYAEAVDSISPIKVQS